MGFFQDMLAVFKKRELVFLERYKESEDIYTFLFKKEKGLTWIAGQHGLFTIMHKKIKNGTRPFTLASAPSEKRIKITMKINDNPSEFKKAMLELKNGMKVSMSGPLGSFTLDNNSPSLLIAAGIGITPFRSIFKQLEAEGNKVEKPIKLLYMDSKRSYVYKEELEEMANKTSIHLRFLDSRDDLQQEIDKFTSSYKENGKYFISGPKSMVDSISNYLKNKDVSKQNMKKDSFYGY